MCGCCGLSAFAISCVVMFLFGFMLISMTQLIPQLTQTLFGYDATLSGFTLGLGGIATLVLMPVAGIVTGRFIQPKWLILMSLAGTGWALWSSARLNLDISFFLGHITGPRNAGGMAAFPVHSAEVLCRMSGCRRTARTSASAMINLMRNLGGSVGVSFTTTMLEQRLQFHHWRTAGRTHHGIYWLRLEYAAVADRYGDSRRRRGS